MKDQNIWNVVYTSSRQEKKVAQRFSDMGVENYLPIVKVVSQWSDRKKIVEKPLFNGYVFVKQVKNPDDILRVTGVAGYLKYNRNHAIVHQHEIDTIKSLINYGYDMTAIDNSSTLEIGEKVIITDGTLKGQIGELVTKNDTKWFVIFFEHFGNGVQVKIPSKLLKSIK